MQLTHALDNPGASPPLQELTRLKHLVCKPVLQVAVGIADGEVARQLLSFPLRLARWLRLGSRRKGELSDLTELSAIGRAVNTTSRAGRNQFRPPALSARSSPERATYRDSMSALRRVGAVLRCVRLLFKPQPLADLGDQVAHRDDPMSTPPFRQSKRQALLGAGRRAEHPDARNNQTACRSASAAACRRSLTSASSRAARSMRSCCNCVRSCWVSARLCWVSARLCWLSARSLTAASCFAIASTVRVSSANWPATLAMSSLVVTLGWSLCRAGTSRARPSIVRSA